MNYIIKNGVLYHHGILGQKWGIRRYQNPDGTLTEEGKKRYRDYWTDVKNRGNEGVKTSMERADKYERDIEIMKSSKSSKEKDRIRNEIRSRFDDEELIKELEKKYGSFDKFIIADLKDSFENEMFFGEQFVLDVIESTNNLNVNLDKQKFTKKQVKRFI